MRGPLTVISPSSPHPWVPTFLPLGRPPLHSITRSIPSMPWQRRLCHHESSARLRPHLAGRLPITPSVLEHQARKPTNLMLQVDSSVSGDFPERPQRLDF